MAQSQPINFNFQMHNTGMEQHVMLLTMCEYSPDLALCTHSDKQSITHRTHVNIKSPQNASVFHKSGNLLDMSIIAPRRPH